MITFAEHQVRAGKAGAPRDFEEMLGLLVRATSGKDARLVFANPGDWGSHGSTLVQHPSLAVFHKARAIAFTTNEATSLLCRRLRPAARRRLHLR